MPKFGPHFEITIDGTSLAYCYIRKNACTAWKNLFINESPHDFSEFKPPVALTFMKTFHKLRRIDDIQSCDRQILIVRNPVERYVSSFLSLFVSRFRNPVPRIEALFTETFGYKFGDITFDIVMDRQLPQVGRKNLNKHFWPQTWHTANVVYSDAILLDSMHTSMEGILGPRVSDRYFANKVNSTSTELGYKDQRATHTPVSDLFDKFIDTKQYPEKECFYGAGRAELISEAYADDTILYETCRQHYASMESKPLSLDLR